MIHRLCIDFPVETLGSGLLLLGWCCLRLFAGCWWMLLRDVWETFGWCWEMFAKCLRDVFEWFCESCWRFFGVMSLECCWGCWRLLKDVLVLSTVSQQSLKLLSHSHSLRNLSTVSQHLSTRFPMPWFLRIQSKKYNNRKQTFHVFCEGPLVVGSVTVLKALNLLSMKLQIKCLRIQLWKKLANKQSFFFVQVHW